jgi:hypothetical protein
MDDPDVHIREIARPPAANSRPGVSRPGQKGQKGDSHHFAQPFRKSSEKVTVTFLPLTFLPLFALFADFCGSSHR